MKSVYDKATREELASRINSLSEQSLAQWGKMNAFQMVKHLSHADDMFQGKIYIKRVFIGRIIGKGLLKKYLKEENLFGKNSPTSPLLVTVGENGDLDEQKKEWLTKLEQYSDFDCHDFVHPFFGPMTKEQIGYFTYKHADHHLKQFGA